MSEYLIVYITGSQYRTTTRASVKYVLKLILQVISNYSGATGDGKYPTTYDDFTVLKDNKPISMEQLRIEGLLEVE